MKKKNYLKWKLLLTISILLVSPSLSQGQIALNEYTILYDTSHGQYFKFENMSKAFAAIKELEAKFMITLTIRELTEQFTSVNLQGSNLLILSNPSEKFETATEEEKSAVETFVGNGGGLLYSSNPLANDQNITGNPRFLNDLMNEQYQPQSILVSKSSNSPNSATVLINDKENNSENESHIVFKKDTIRSSALTSGVDNVEEVLFYGSPVEDTYAGSPEGYLEFETGNVSDGSYYINDDYGTGFADYWFLGRQFLNSEGRALTIGSTIMFSDLLYDTETNTSWIEVKDNQIFLQNIVAWLLQLDVEPQTTGNLDLNFIGVIGYLILITVLVSILFFLVVFGMNIMRKNFALHEIFNFKRRANIVKKKKIPTEKDSVATSRTRKKSPKKKKIRGKV